MYLSKDLDSLYPEHPDPEKHTLSDSIQLPVLIINIQSIRRRNQTFCSIFKLLSILEIQQCINFLICINWYTGWLVCLSAVNSDAAIALELPQTVIVSANAAVVKVTAFFFHDYCFPPCSAKNSDIFCCES